MTMRRVWLWSLAAACYWNCAVCPAEDGSTDLINDVDPPVVVEVDAATPVEAQVIEIVIDEKSQPGAADGIFNIQVAPPAGPNRADAQAVISFTPNGQLFTAALDVGDLAAVEPGKYWIGLLCVDPGDALRAQLGLGEGVGLLVEAVTDESPAKRAGIGQHDVLVALHDKNNSTVRVLKQVKELVAEVQAAETKSLFVEVIRKGQHQVIEVVPAERPKPTEVRGVLIQNLDARLGEQLLGLRLAGPVFAFNELRHVLPAGMTMEFHQVVGQPEKITVKKGEQTWELTEGTLDNAPEDVRVAVLQQLAARRAGPLPQMSVLPPTFTAGNPEHLKFFTAWATQAAVDPNSRPVSSATQAEAVARAQAAKAEAVARVNVIRAKTDAAIPHLHVTGQSPLVVTATALALPDDVTVSIVRKGTEPAKITVKKGKQTWDVTEKELDKLPEELRKHADSVLKGQALRTWKTRTIPVGASPPTVSSIPLQPPRASGSPIATTEHDRVAMEAQQKELQRRVAAVAEQQKKEAAQQREQLEIREQLQKLNDKIEKLQQALEKSVPKP